MVHNTDDHLRNHGFFIGPRGIALSPAYDINPSIERAHLTLAIDEHETSCDRSVAMDACKDYGVSVQRAAKILRQMKSAIADWPAAAAGQRIPGAEQNLMKRAFQG
jgi:serine/threonine-protein kinase HipA